MRDTGYRRCGYEQRKFGIYIPSYKRATTISTHKLLEYYKVVVRKSEETEYLKVIPKENLIAVPDEEINNIVKVVNWIVDNSEEDVIAMIDDDMNDLIYRLDFNEKITDPEVITSELERIAQLMVDLDIGYGAVDASIAPWNYAQEFTFAGTSGGLRWFNKKVYKARFDEKIGYCLRYRCGVTGTAQEQNYPQAKVSVFPRSNGCKFRRKFPKDPKRPNSQFRVDEAQMGQVFRLSVKDQ